MENFIEKRLPENSAFQDLIENLPRGTSSEVAEILELSTSRVSQMLHSNTERHRIEAPLKTVLRRKIQKLQKFVDEPPIVSFVDHHPESLANMERQFAMP